MGIFNNRLLLTYCFLEIFVWGQGLDERGQSRDGGIPQSPPPTRENPGMYATGWVFRVVLMKA